MELEHRLRSGSKIRTWRAYVFVAELELAHLDQAWASVLARQLGTNCLLGPRNTTSPAGVTNGCPPPFPEREFQPRHTCSWAQLRWLTGGFHDTHSHMLPAANIHSARQKVERSSLLVDKRLHHSKMAASEIPSLLAICGGVTSWVMKFGAASLGQKTERYPCLPASLNI